MENDRGRIRNKIARIGAWGASSAGRGLGGPIVQKEVIGEEPKPAEDITTQKVVEPTGIWAPRGNKQRPW